MSFKFQLNENGEIDWSRPLILSSSSIVTSAKKSAEKRKRAPLTELPRIQPLNLTPAQWKALTGEAKSTLLPVSRFASNSAKKRKFVVDKSQIQPLKLTEDEKRALSDAAEPQAKIAKKTAHVQNTVRKTLFTKGEKPKKSITGQARISKITKPKLTEKPSTSPLVNIEEVEESIIKNNMAFPFKSPIQPNIKITKATPDRLSSRRFKMNEKTPKKEQTPNSQTSNDQEFLELEKNFLQEEQENIDSSPVSSVCNLLENAKLQSAKKPTILSSNYNLKQSIEHLKKIIEIEQIEFAQYQKKHQQRMADFHEILQNLENANFSQSNGEIRSDDSENNNNLRRSLRLAKSPRPAKNGKVIASPIFSKSVDLRKTTLNRNLQNSTKKKAGEISSSKSNSSIMATPKFDRTMTPNITKRTLNLRRDIQTQYSKLQETPAHK